MKTRMTRRKALRLGAAAGALPLCMSAPPEPRAA